METSETRGRAQSTTRCGTSPCSSPLLGRAEPPRGSHPAASLGGLLATSSRTRCRAGRVAARRAPALGSVRVKVPVSVQPWEGGEDRLVGFGRPGARSAAWGTGGLLPEGRGIHFQRKWLKTGRQQERHAGGRGPSGWLIGGRTGAREGAQCAPELGAGKASGLLSN